MWWGEHNLSKSKQESSSENIGKHTDRDWAGVGGNCVRTQFWQLTRLFSRYHNTMPNLLWGESSVLSLSLAVHGWDFWVQIECHQQRITARDSHRFLSMNLWRSTWVGMCDQHVVYPTYSRMRVHDKGKGWWCHPSSSWTVQQKLIQPLQP